MARPGERKNAESAEDVSCRKTYRYRTYLADMMVHNTGDGCGFWHCFIRTLSLRERLPIGRAAETARLAFGSNEVERVSLGTAGELTRAHGEESSVGRTGVASSLVEVVSRGQKELPFGCALFAADKRNGR